MFGTPRGIIDDAKPVQGHDGEVAGFLTHNACLDCLCKYLLFVSHASLKTVWVS